MRRIFPALAALVFAAASVAACHHKSESAPAQLTLAQFYSGVAAAEAQLATCQLGLAPQTAASVYGLSEDAALEVEEQTEQLAAKQLTFDPVKAAACLAALKPPADCWSATASVQALLLAPPADCLGVVQGASAPGAPCTDDSTCLAGSCNTTACPGSCIAALADGGTCTGSDQCASGSVCNIGLCAAPGAAGNDCKKNNDCIPGLACITVIERSARGENGAAGELAGNGGPLTPDGTCAFPLDGGSACDPEYSNPCAAGFWCQLEADAGAPSDGTCIAQLAAGSPCTAGHGPTGFTEALESEQCLGHQICAGLLVDGMGNAVTPGRCDAPHDLGGACVATGVAATQGCLLGLLCDANQTCAAPPAQGQPCAVPPSDNSGLLVDYCAPGSYCDSPSNGGTCQAKVADGAGCTANTGCLSGSCKSYLCADATSSACTPDAGS